MVTANNDVVIPRVTTPAGLPEAWIMTQTWNDLLFVHWPLPPAALLPCVPRGLTLDTFAGQAWLGITPFWISRLHARGVPPIPGTARFHEINVRTYVRGPGGSGVLFLSLDAANILAVLGARIVYHLPYFNTQATHTCAGRRIRYVSRRRHPGAPGAVFIAGYEPVSGVFNASPGSLEHWLSARFRLFAQDSRGCLYKAEIRHKAWPLQEARARIVRNTMAEAHGLRLPDIPPLLHYTRRLTTFFWLPEQVLPEMDTYDPDIDVKAI
jgi:uncharacterized protein YqjF (DUF2071 family)